MNLQGPDGDRITELILQRMRPRKGYTFRAVKSMVADMPGTQKPTMNQLRSLLTGRREFLYNPANRHWSRRQDLRMVYNVRTRHYEVIDETDGDGHKEAKLVAAVHDQELISLVLKASNGSPVVP